MKNSRISLFLTFWPINVIGSTCFYWSIWRFRGTSEPVSGFLYFLVGAIPFCGMIALLSLLILPARDSSAALKPGSKVKRALIGLMISSVLLGFALIWSLQHTPQTSQWPRRLSKEEVETILKKELELDWVVLEPVPPENDHLAGEMSRGGVRYAIHVKHTRSGFNYEADAPHGGGLGGGFAFSKNPF